MVGARELVVGSLVERGDGRKCALGHFAVHSGIDEGPATLFGHESALEFSMDVFTIRSEVALEQTFFFEVFAEPTSTASRDIRACESQIRIVEGNDTIQAIRCAVMRYQNRSEVKYLWKLWLSLLRILIYCLQKGDNFLGASLK